MNQQQPFHDGNAIRAAIRARSKAETADGRTTFQQLWIMQRLVARLAEAPDTTWAIKGAQALLVRLPHTPRTTKDIDAVIQASSTHDAVDAFRRAIARPTPEQDFLTFALNDVSSSPSRPDLVKLRVQPTMDLGTRSQKMPMIGLDMLVTPQLDFDPDLIELSPKIDIGRFTDWPQVPVVSSAVHVAEKLVATATTHDGRPSTRDRDFTDLVLLCQHYPPSVEELTAQLHKAVAAPRPAHNTVSLPRSFIPSESAVSFYRQLPGLLPLDQALEVVRGVIDPALERYHNEHSAGLRARSIMLTALTSTPALSQEARIQEPKPPRQSLPTVRENQGRTI